MEYYLNLTFSLFSFIIGTLFGSFFTLATYRLPRHQDIVKTRSYCPNCKHRLGFFDCFPILSYISTIGRCRYCKKSISIRYPLIEFASGMVFLLIYLIFGFSWRALVLVACYVYLFLTIGADIMEKKMTQEEKDEVLKIKENKKNKSKAGAINSEVLVAIVIFIIFFVSTIFITRNYRGTLIEYNRKSNALNICLNEINTAKAIQFENLTASTKTLEVDHLMYTCETNIGNYEKGGVVLSNVKVIETTVSYLHNGQENSISLKSVKVANI